MLGSWSSGSSGPGGRPRLGSPAKAALIRCAQGRFRIRRQLMNDRIHLVTGLVIVLRRHLLQVYVVQQFPMDSKLQVQIDAEIQVTSSLCVV